MKTIVISGVSSKVGKTSLALAVRDMLPNSVFIKIGHGKEKRGKNNVFFYVETPFPKIVSKHAGAQYLVIESNSVLKELEPDLTIFLEGFGSKPSAAMAREKADIRRGQSINPAKIGQLARALGVDSKVVQKIAWLAGARPEAGS